MTGKKSKIAGLTASASMPFASRVAGKDRTPEATDARQRAELERNFAAIVEGLMEKYPNQPSQCLWRVRESAAIKEPQFDEPIQDVGCGEGGKAESLFDYFCEVLHCLQMDDADKWRERFESAGWSEYSIRPIVEPEAMILFSALELFWMSPFPLYRRSRRNPGQIGWMINRFLDKGGRRPAAWKKFWGDYLTRFMGAMPDPPPVGAGWLLWARKR